MAITHFDFRQTYYSSLIIRKILSSIPQIFLLFKQKKKEKKKRKNPKQNKKTPRR